MDLLKQILESSHYSVITALVLGLMTAISPCPLTTNITAIGYISRDINGRGTVFLKGLTYTLGRAVSYTGLAFILFLGADKVNITRIFQGWGEKLLAPVLIILGLTMLDIIRVRFPALDKITERFGEKGKVRYTGSFLLGMLFALAFCPYSGVLYFTILIPLTISSASGLYLPVVFAVATGLPVIIFAWLIAYSVGSLGNIYNRIRIFELWFRRVVAILFILAGIYYIIKWIV